MKLKKKTAMLVSFALGTLLFGTTALADLANKSGYDQLKDALKVTAENASEKLNSFTLDVSFALKDNGNTLRSENSVLKFDRSKGATETLSYNENKLSRRHYSDKTTTISSSDSDPTYYVTEFTKERKSEAFNNPFKENRAEDLEKIADAIVGSLKDHVVVTENSNGSKNLSGSLSEIQIPSLVNALASFQAKQEFRGNYGPMGAPMPHLTQDIFVKEVKGTASINQDGVLESVLGTAVLSGKDELGQVHNITVEVLAKLTGINSTTVSKPDLTGKKVVKQISKQENFGAEISDPQKFIGKFKNDIVIEKDGKFTKIGERLIDITHMDNKTVAGRYHEEYKKGFEEYATKQRDFSFDASFDRDSRGTNFDYTNESGAKLRGSFYFDDYMGKIHWNFENPSMGSIFDSTFSPAFE